MKRKNLLIIIAVLTIIFFAVEFYYFNCNVLWSTNPLHAGKECSMQQLKTYRTLIYSTLAVMWIAGIIYWIKEKNAKNNPKSRREKKMNKRLLSLIAICIVLAPIVAASQEISIDKSITITTQLKQLEGQQVPSIAQKLLAENERINLFVDDTSANIILENYKVASVSPGSLTDNTITITTSQSAIDKLLASEDVKTTAKELLAKKEIKIQTKGFFKKIKFGIAKLILKFF